MISDIAKNEYDTVIEVWEASVRATHHFLKETDISFFKQIICDKYLDAVKLYAIRDELHMILGFMAISGDAIEMLFIHPNARGRGLGRKFINHAINNLNARKVDVNEQNEQAIGFYKKMGFVVKSRDEFDSTGKPYPILHMELE